MTETQTIINDELRQSRQPADVLNSATEEAFVRCYFSTRDDSEDAVFWAFSAVPARSATNDEDGEIS